MKKLLGIMVLGLMLSVNAYANITGLYSGKLKYSNGDNYPMVSEFKVNNEDEVWGKYSYKYKGKNYKGTFYEGKLEGIDLKIFWQDEFGKGWLKITFDDDFENFNGDWGGIKKKKEKRKTGEWTGKKLY
jgi:hypothetical protein